LKIVRAELLKNDMDPDRYFVRSIKFNKIIKIHLKRRGYVFGGEVEIEIDKNTMKIIKFNSLC